MKNTVSAILTFTLFAGLLAGCSTTGQVSGGDPGSETIPFTPHNGGSTNVPCPGVYTGYAKYTNSLGELWVTPPTNATTGTLTDASGYPSPYASVACVMRKGTVTPWCGASGVTFPATNSSTYSLTIYVTSPTPPPGTNQPVTIQIQWQ